MVQLTVEEIVILQKVAIVTIPEVEAIIILVIEIILQGQVTIEAVLAATLGLLLEVQVIIGVVEVVAQDQVTIEVTLLDLPLEALATTEAVTAVQDLHQEAQEVPLTVRERKKTNH